MAYPLPNPFDPSDLNPGPARSAQAPDPAHGHAAPERHLDVAVGDDGLQRLEASLQWLKRETMIAAIEVGLRAQEKGLKLPRAGPLPAASGIGAADAKGLRHKREALTFPAPVLTAERPPPPAPRNERRYDLRGPLCILIASAIAGSIVYHVSAGALSPAWEPAQAAFLQSQCWQNAVSDVSPLQ